MRQPAGHFRSTFKTSVKAIAAAAALVLAVAAAPTAALAAPNAAIVVDAKTGKTLYASNANAKRHPASLTKMMTLYMLFEAVESGRTSLNSSIVFSARAAGQSPSKLGLRKGQSIRVKDAILALVTKSANDVATAVAEHLAGTESAFAKRMTARARELGMSRTVFRNASGLPNKSQVTTAADMAVLGRALRDHYPQYFHYFKTSRFTYRGKTYGNHNKLLGRVAGVDGIKTGYTRASGFNLVTSVVHNHRYVVAVVIGGDTGKARDNRMAALIKKYMPRASKGPRTVAMVPGSRSAAMRLVAVTEYPMPRRRPGGPIVLTPDSTASVVGANSIFAIEGLAQGDTSPEEAEAIEAVGAVNTAGAIARVAPDEDGWKIQLAATPTLDSAEAILERATASAGALLAGVTPYTEPVEKSGTTLYRARFGGFADKAAARAACTEVKRAKFDCIALK